jgi:outer membrane protein assembly factor BamB
VLFTHNSRRILSTATGGHILGADPASGALLWAFGHKARLDTHVVPPLYGQGLVYYVSGEDAGGGALELSPDGGAIVPKWADRTLDCLHTGVVLVNGHLYGTGFRGRKLVCLELATGKVMWATKEVGEGATVAADGMLFVYEGPKKGVVSLVKADPSGFVRTGQFTVTDGTDQHWAHPTIANGHLYLRHGDALAAYRVSAESK